MRKDTSIQGVHQGARLCEVTMLGWKQKTKKSQSKTNPSLLFFSGELDELYYLNFYCGFATFCVRWHISRQLFRRCNFVSSDSLIFFQACPSADSAWVHILPWGRPRLFVYVKLWCVFVSSTIASCWRRLAKWNRSTNSLSLQCN